MRLYLQHLGMILREKRETEFARSQYHFRYLMDLIIDYDGFADTKCIPRKQNVKGGCPEQLIRKGTAQIITMKEMRM